MRMLLRKMLLCLPVILLCPASSVQAQFFDPQSSIIVSVLREISLKHQLGLQEQRVQTAKLVQQLRQFYDSYTIMRRDFEFTRNLYNDFRAIDNMRNLNAYAVSNFIVNGDRINYWLPRTTGELNRRLLDTEALLNNADALKRTYDSFALSIDDERVPTDVRQRRHNALVGQEAFSRALFEQALHNQQAAATYDSLAIELYNQVVDNRNKFTEAERTQFLIESVKLRELSNSHYEKYLKMSQELHTNEVNMFDEKMGFLQSQVNWRNFKNQANKISKIRYGFFDISPGQIR